MTAQEYRVIGPPGTGKTSFIRAQVQKWTDEGRYDPSDFVLTSFTRAAAVELRGRVPVPADRASTLHALGWRALDRPPIAETAPLVHDWNSQQLPPAWRIPVSDRRPEDPYGDEPHDPQEGAVFEAYCYWRALGRTGPYTARRDVQAFARAWEDFKKQTGSIDFMDMIELPLREGLPCPGRPRVLMVDEAQDLVPLQWALVRHWAAGCREFVVAGDPAQCIYGWVGASPAALLEPIAPERLRVLGRSHRLPARVHAFAEAFLARRSPELSRNRTYRPREEEGLVRRMQCSFRDPEPLVEELLRRLRTGEETLMVLASCAYMLRPTLALLREAGVPFHNPYRVTRGDWNPLRRPREGETSTVDRVLAFLRPDPGTWGNDAREWTAQDLRLWAEMLRAEAFGERGLKTAALKGLEESSDPAYMLLACLKPEDTRRAEQLDTEWLASQVLKKFEAVVKYAAAVRRSFGGAALRKRPRLIIGTIHSVKGGEADVVYVFPDISPRAEQQAHERPDVWAELTRVFYVAATRARKELVLLEPANMRLAVDW